jgi:hypothetical protein
LRDVYLRERLRQLNKERLPIIATFVRFGRAKSKNGYLNTTVLFTDVKDEKGDLLTDHAWMGMGKRFERLNLTSGDILRFNARIKSYTKGYSEDSEENPFRIDFKLSYPSKAEKIGFDDEGDYDNDFSLKVLADIKEHNDFNKLRRQRAYDYVQNKLNEGESMKKVPKKIKKVKKGSADLKSKSKDRTHVNNYLNLEDYINEINKSRAINS